MFSFADFISSLRLLILEVPQCFSFPLKLCKDGLQYVGGVSGFTPSRESVCLLCDGEEPQEPTSTATASSIAASRFPKAPDFTHLSLPAPINFNSGECPGAGIDTRSK